MARRSDLSPAQFARNLAGWLLWLICLAVAAGVLFAALYLMLGFSLFATRLAVCILISACLALVLFHLHSRASDDRRLIFPMKIVLGLFCVSIFVILWCVSASGGASGKTVYVTNGTKNTLHVKIIRIGQIGVLGDEAREQECPPGQARLVRLPGSGSGFTYAVIAFEYYSSDSHIALPAFLQGLEKFLPKGIGQIKCRAVFPSETMPQELEFITKDGTTVLVQDIRREAPAVEQEEEQEEDDPYRIPLPVRE